MAKQKAFKGRGLLERFLFLVPKSKLGYRTLDTQPVSAGQRLGYRAELQKLLNLEVRKNALGNAEPRLLALAPEALDRFMAFRQEIERDLASDGRLNAVAGWAGKLAGNCVRIAGLLHVAEHGEATPVILGNSMGRAVGLCRALVEHALAAFAMMQTDQAVQDAEAIYQWILQRGEARLGRTECLKKFHGRFLDKKRYEAALEALQHHNIISTARKETDEDTKRARKYYEVNPMIFDRKG